MVDAICAAIAQETSVDVAELLALKTFVDDRLGHDYRYAIDPAMLEEELGWAPRRTLDDAHGP